MCLLEHIPSEGPLCRWLESLANSPPTEGASLRWPGILGGDQHKRNGQCLQMTFVSLSCDTYRSPMLS